MEMGCFCEQKSDKNSFHVAKIDSIAMTKLKGGDGNLNLKEQNVGFTNLADEAMMVYFYPPSVISVWTGLETTNITSCHV